MQRTLHLGAIICAVFMFTATSRGDVATPRLPAPLPVDAIDEPITSAPARSAPGSETKQHDPFTPYDTGTDRVWHYSDLTPAEQAVVDKGRDTKGWDRIHDGYASAVEELAQQARAQASAHQLGVTDDLAATGVVP